MTMRTVMMVKIFAYNRKIDLYTIQTNIFYTNISVTCETPVAKYLSVSVSFSAWLLGERDMLL